MALMGIDIGSGGCKCAAFAVDGRLLAAREREYGRPAGSCEFDGMTIWRLVCDMASEVAAEAGEAVSAVGVASIGEAIAPVDRAGAPLASFPQSTFKGGDKYLDEIRALVGDRVREVTGLNPLARYSLCKLMYFRRERPDAFRAAWKFMMLEDFIVFRLCGVAASDYSAATRSAAFNLEEKRYDNAILAAVGLDASRLCDVFPAGSAVGRVTAEASRLTGIPEGAAVVLAGHDTIPENLCSGLLAAGTASVGCGSFEGVGVLVPERPGPNAQLLANNFSREPYPLAGFEFVNGINPNAGNLLKWFRAEFADAERRAAADRGRSAFQLLDEAMPDEPTPLLVVPHFAGSGAPEFNPAARGAVLGLTLSTRRTDIYKAFLEAVAYEMAYIVDKYRECGVDIAEITAASGGAKSRAWLQIRADVLGLPFTPLRTGETTLAGSAMLAGVGSGAYGDLRDAAERFVEKGEPVRPDAARHARYREQYARYLEARAMLLDFWSRRG